MIRFLPAACLVALLALSGCSTKTVAVQGAVTFQGKPLDEAVIQFVPLAKGKVNGGEIRNGQYALAAERGLLPGKYRVEIRDNPPLDVGHHPAKYTTRRILPERHATSSKLEFEVPAEASEMLTFNVAL